MKFQQQLDNKREKLHAQKRNLKFSQQKISNRMKFLDKVQKNLLKHPLLHIQTALQNLKNNIHIQNSLQSIIYQLQNMNDEKQKYRVIMNMIDKGILHYFAKFLQKRVYIQQIMNLIVIISAIDNQKMGKYIIRSEILAQVLAIIDFSSLIITRKFFCLLGNICSEDLQNRNLIEDSSIHFEIIRQIQQRVKLIPTIYTEQTSEDQKTLWNYRFWFLNEFYSYQIPGQVLPQRLVQMLITLINPYTPHKILTRVINLVSNLIDQNTNISRLAETVDKMLLYLNPQSTFILQFTYMLSQFSEIPIYNFRPLLGIFNPDYFGVIVRNNIYQSYIMRILYARRQQLDSIPQIHQQTFWQNILSKSLIPFERYMLISILGAINLQNIDWVFESLCTTLTNNEDVVQVKAALDFILIQIERKGKNIVGVAMEKCGLDKVLLNLERRKNRQIYVKLFKILEFYN